MHCFRDKSGQEWPIELTTGAIVRIRAESSGRFDFFDPMKNELCQTLADDLPTCWEALWYVCAPQARERKVSAEEFGRLLADDVLLDAQAALFDEWRAFFRRLRRENLALVVEKAAKYQAKALELVKARMSDPLLTTLDDRVTAALENKLSESFGNLRENLASTLGPTPGDNSP